jgi:mono/diheme cytochrome c family protein
MPAIPNFTNPAWQKSRTNPQLVISILEGKNLQMPANRGPVTDEQAPDLVAYIRTFGPVVAALPPVGTAAGSSDFEVEINKLAQQWEEMDRHLRDLSSAPAASTLDKEGAAAALYARPFAPDDIDRGRELFMGQRPFAAGGASCIACHAVDGSGPREGGRLGPDLTKVYERVGGRAGLTAQLLTPTTPAMCALYQQHSLEPDEASSLAAYLEETDKIGVEQASAPPLNFLLMGLGGTVLGLATVSTFWRSRFAPRSRPPLNAKGAPTRRSDLPVRGKRRAMVGTAAQTIATARLPEDHIGSGL